MAEFNPVFQFEDGDILLPSNDVAPEFIPSSYKLDEIINKYRAENSEKLGGQIDEDIEVEESSEGVKCQITDKLRHKTKLKKSKRAIQEEEEQYTFMQSVTKYTDVDSFMGFKLSKPILKALTEMGVFTPTPIQCACIPVALMNRDICGCARTGSGKTLAFLLPIIERMVYAPAASRSSTKALIISPTRELAVQIFNVAEQLVKYCPRLKIQLAAGGLDLSSQEASLRTNPDIVVATPGRLIDHLSNAPNFTLDCIEYLVLDEADKLLDEYFAEQTKEIVRHCISQRQTLLFSATMTETVRELAMMSLKNPVRVFLNQSTAVASRLEQEFVRIRPQREVDRDAMLAALLVRSFPNQRTIVFLPTKRDCHRMHLLLGLMGLQCAELHGDMNQPQRLDALQRFTDAVTTGITTKTPKGIGSAPITDQPEVAPPVNILLATDLAARGLDIAGVQIVINYKLPNNIKGYVHRVGRTARAANCGRAVSLASEADRKLLKEVIKDAPCPVKARVIPQEVISRFNARIAKIKPFMEEILTTEAEEREMSAAQSHLEKAERLASRCADHKGSAAPPPKRINWFSEKRDAERAAKRGKKTNKKQPSKQLRKDK